MERRLFKITLELSNEQKQMKLNKHVQDIVIYLVIVGSKSKEQFRCSEHCAKCSTVKPSRNKSGTIYTNKFYP